MEGFGFAELPPEFVQAIQQQQDHQRMHVESLRLERARWLVSLDDETLRMVAELLSECSDPETGPGRAEYLHGLLSGVSISRLVNAAITPADILPEA